MVLICLRMRLWSHHTCTKVKWNHGSKSSETHPESLAKNLGTLRHQVLCFIHFINHLVFGSRKVGWLQSLKIDHTQFFQVSLCRWHAIQVQQFQKWTVPYLKGLLFSWWDPSQKKAASGVKPTRQGAKSLSVKWFLTVTEHLYSKSHMVQSEEIKGGQGISIEPFLAPTTKWHHTYREKVYRCHPFTSLDCFYISESKTDGDALYYNYGDAHVILDQNRLVQVFKLYPVLR